MISHDLDESTRRAGCRQTVQHDGPKCERFIEGARPMPNYMRRCDDEPTTGTADETVTTDLLLVTLDPISYSSKPTGKEMGAITRRMQAAGPANITTAEFVEHVRAGKTWCAGTFKPNAYKWGAFLGQQLFAVDIDGKTKDGRQLHEGDAGFLHPLAALDRCVDHCVTPLCLYFTFSAVCTGVDATSTHRFRVVFDAGAPLGKEEAENMRKRLLKLFPEADPACRNANRLWLGSCGEVWEIAKAWEGAVPWAS